MLKDYPTISDRLDAEEQIDYGSHFKSVTFTMQEGQQELSIITEKIQVPELLLELEVLGGGYIADDSIIDRTAKCLPDT